MHYRSMDVVGFGLCLSGSSKTAGFVVPLVRSKGVDELNGESMEEVVVEGLQLTGVGILCVITVWWRMDQFRGRLG